MIRSTLIAALLFVSPLVASAQNIEQGDEPNVASSITTESTIAPWTRFYNDISFGFFNVSNAPFEQMNKGEASVGSYNYLSVNYRISRDLRLAFRPVFMANTAGTSNRGDAIDSSFVFGDAYLNLGWTIRSRPETDFNAKISLRTYAPTSNQSRDQGLITRIRPELIFEQWFGRKVSYEIRLEPDYYIQGRRASYNASNGKVQTNFHWGYKSIMGPIYHFNRDFGAQVALGYDQTTSHTSPENNLHNKFVKESFKTQVSMLGSIGPVFFIAGVTQDHNTRRGEAFDFFKKEQLEYFILNYWTL